MSYSDSGTADYFEIKRLREEVIKALSDAYSRAHVRRCVELYEKYFDLKRNYQVKLVGPFIVIEGGLKPRID